MSNDIKIMGVTENIQIKAPIDIILETILRVVQPYDFREALSIDDDTRLSKHDYLVVTVEAVLKIAIDLGFSLTVKNGQVYIFNGEYWHPIDAEVIENFLGDVALKMGIPYTKAKHYVFRTELFKQFISSSFTTPKPKDTNEVLVNLKNGTFAVSLESQELRPFRKEDFMTYQLPFDYDSNAKASLFEKFLNRVLPDIEQQAILAEYLGYVFIKNNALKLEKFLILYGGGSNGKSVVFDVVSAVYGNENVSSYSLESLTDSNGYFRASLVNKLLNYSSEISSKMNSTIFKQLVSGERVEARLPYGRPFHLDNYAKLMFNSNDLPRDAEHNWAFYRRFLILLFNVTISEEERDPELAKKIIATELPGVFNWILGGLSRLLQNKTFTPSREMKEMLDQYRVDSDSVLSFLDDESYEISIHHEMKLSLFYQDYTDYCKRSGLRAGSVKLFSKRLKTYKFQTFKKNKGMFIGVQKKDVSIPSLDALGSPNGEGEGSE